MMMHGLTNPKSSDYLWALWFFKHLSKCTIFIHYMYLLCFCYMFRCYTNIRDNFVCCYAANIYGYYSSYVVNIKGTAFTNWFLQYSTGGIVHPPSPALVAQGQLLPPQGLSVSAISSGSTYYPHILVVCQLFQLSALGTPTAAWAAGKGVCVGVFDALTIFRCEVVLLQTLNPSSSLYLQISRAQQSGQSRVVVVWVELLSVRILVEILECLDNCR
jgi:hypothetical protein